MAEQSENVIPSRSRPGDRLAELVVSAEPHQDAPPTPPYRQYPASISDDIQSPPYRSRSQVHLADATDEKREGATDRDMGFVDEKHQPSDNGSSPDHDHDHLDPEHEKTPAKGVHYPDTIPHIEKPVKFESSTSLPDRAPSTVPSELEDNLAQADDDNYDWSTDDEEVDEEAKKFELKVDGSTKRNVFLR